MGCVLELCSCHNATLCGRVPWEGCRGGASPVEWPCVSPASMEGSRKPVNADPAWPFLLTLESAVRGSLGRCILSQLCSPVGSCGRQRVLGEQCYDWGLTNTTEQSLPQPAVLRLRVSGDGVQEGKLSPTASLCDTRFPREYKANLTMAVASWKRKLQHAGLRNSGNLTLRGHHLKLCSV